MHNASGNKTAIANDDWRRHGITGGGGVGLGAQHSAGVGGVEFPAAQRREEETKTFKCMPSILCTYEFHAQLLEKVFFFPEDSEGTKFASTFRRFFKRKLKESVRNNFVSKGNN